MARGGLCKIIAAGESPRFFPHLFLCFVLSVAWLLTPGCLTLEIGDEDGDGYTADEGDCVDTNPVVHPGATDTADGIDNDCDGTTDEDAPAPSEANDDQDGDGFALDEEDCDDGDPSVYPGAAEESNGRDDDCDGEVDETPLPQEVDATPAIEDGDDTPMTPGEDETPPPSRDEDGDGYAAVDDCDDHDATAYPNAPEVFDGVDNDCNGVIDDGVASTDVDLDRDGADALIDCDDDDPESYPGATEICDDKDNDCDGEVDGPNPADGLEAYEDRDGDAYGNPETARIVCEASPGYVWNDLDCDDQDPSTHPSATEVGDGVDNDCDGEIDEDTGGDPIGPTQAGDDDDVIDLNPEDLDGDGWVSDQDCDDEDASIHPYAEELIDEIDNDCDGEIDEPTSGPLEDMDGDGYPVGHGDCNDRNNLVHPDADEVCNSVDDDCDGRVDEDLPFATYYQDRDGDGYGVSSTIQVSCAALPVGYAFVDGDCNDANPEISPEAVEQCNGLDDDCDQVTDEAGAEGASTWYPDLDTDGYGNPDKPLEACFQPEGFVANGSDCDDDDPDVNPDAVEIANHQDSNCDGRIDE